MRYGRKALRILVKVVLTICVIICIFTMPWMAVQSGEMAARIWMGD